MKKEMLINVLQPEECRIAILEDSVLEELYVERTSQESYVGNIYKGRIVNIEPSIQAAFVDFGIGRNGFLHVSDVDPAYYRHIEPRREGGRRPPRGEERGRGRGRERQRREPVRESDEAVAAVEAGPSPTAEDERVFGAGILEDEQVTPPADAEAAEPAEAEPAGSGRKRR